MYLLTVMLQATDISFTVVIPAYNAATTIERAVATCRSQTYPPKEIIIIDDCSDDETRTWLQSNPHPLIKYIFHQQNAGPSAARNTGIKASTGSHIAFLDADDEWHPRKLECIAAALTIKPVGFIFHHFSMAALPEQPASAVLKPFPIMRLMIANRITPSCVVLSRQAAQLFDERMHYMEDLDVWLRISVYETIYELPLILTRIPRPHLSAGGQSARKWAMRKGELRCWIHYAKQRPLWYLLMPLLFLWGMAKHIRSLLFK